jgi:hypothetical protein
MADEDSLIEELKREEDAGMARTKEWVGMWQENLGYFLSEQLAGVKRHKDWTWVILNYIWPSIMQETAKLSRNYPKIIAEGVEDSDSDYAQSWQGLLQWQWENALSPRGMRLEQIYGIVIGKIWGYRLSKVFWDPKPDGGWDPNQRTWVGHVRHRLWHPAEFWSSENEFINEGNCGTVRYVDVEWAKARWPQHKKKFDDRSVSYREANNSNTIRGQTSNGGSISTIGTGDPDPGVKTGPLLSLIQKTERMSGMQSENDLDKRFVKISEAYRKDRTEVTRKQEEAVPVEEMVANGFTLGVDGRVYDPQTLEPVDPPIRTVAQWDEPKFPNGRYILRCEDTILNAGQENQIYPYSKWPFIVSPHYLLPFMWQGTDAVQLYKATQDMINVTASHLTNNMKQFGDPRIAVEEGALAQDARAKSKRAYKIFRGAGSIIRLARGGLNRYKIEPPTPISSGTLAMYGLFAQEFKNITGLQDVGQGKSTPGTQTKAEVQILAISANDRIHLQSVFEDEWVKNVASMTAEITRLNYDVDRLVQIIGDDRTPSALRMTQELKDFNMDVKVESGTTLPFDEQERIAKYVQAYQMMGEPVANPMLPEMLRVLEISGWQRLLQKHEAWIQYSEFLQLYEMLKAGEITPEEAIRVLSVRVAEIIAQDQARNPQPQENENAQGTEA